MFVIIIIGGGEGEEEYCRLNNRNLIILLLWLYVYIAHMTRRLKKQIWMLNLKTILFTKERVNKG